LDSCFIIIDLGYVDTGIVPVSLLVCYFPVKSSPLGEGGWVFSDISLIVQANILNMLDFAVATSRFSLPVVEGYLISPFSFATTSSCNFNYL
jgi:hypothetical protein